MQSPRLKLPFAARVIFFIIGVGSALLPFHALRTGAIDASDHGFKIDIRQAQEPIAFWSLVVIFAVLSAVMFCGAFVKGKADA